MKIKRIAFLVVSAVLTVSASLFAGNSVKAKAKQTKSDNQTQLVLTQGSDLSSDSYLLAGHSSHVSHDSHVSHISHRSHISHYSSR